MPRVDAAQVTPAFFFSTSPDTPPAGFVCDVAANDSPGESSPFVSRPPSGVCSRRYTYVLTTFGWDGGGFPSRPAASCLLFLTRLARLEVQMGSGGSEEEEEEGVGGER